MMSGLYKPPSPVEVGNVLRELLIKEITSDGHFRFIEGVFEHVVAIQVIDPAGAVKKHRLKDY